MEFLMAEIKIKKQNLGETGDVIENQCKLRGKLFFIWQRQDRQQQKIQLKEMAEKRQEKKKYAHISHKLRLELIDLVQKENYPLSVASDLLEVKLSTAKLIMNKYKSRGYVTKYKRQKTLEDQSNSSTILNRKHKKQTNLPHPHPTTSSPDPHEHPKKDELTQKHETEEKRNETEIPYENTCYGIFPLNGMMIPFFYVWNVPL